MKPSGFSRSRSVLPVYQFENTLTGQKSVKLGILLFIQWLRSYNFNLWKMCAYGSNDEVGHGEHWRFGHLKRLSLYDFYIKVNLRIQYRDWRVTLPLRNIFEWLKIQYRNLISAARYSTYIKPLLLISFHFLLLGQSNIEYVLVPARGRNHHIRYAWT